jgi:hypothetical protein
MPNTRFLPLFSILAACGNVMPADPGADATASDAVGSPDAGIVCDPATPFDAPVPLAGLVANQGMVRLSNDELTAVFQDWNADYQIFTAGRRSIDGAFTGSMALAVVNSPAQDSDASLGDDGLRLFFGSTRAGDGTHVYVATRAATSQAFGEPARLTDIESPTGSDDAQPYVRADGGELWFSSARDGSLGGRDLYRAEASGSGFSAR